MCVLVSLSRVSMSEVSMKTNSTFKKNLIFFKSSLKITFNGNTYHFNAAALKIILQKLKPAV